jgi:DNA-binding NtrC family response regulator
MDQVEREVIAYVLKKTAWNRSKATKILKISYKTLLYKIKDLGIQPPPDAIG